MAKDNNKTNALRLLDRAKIDYKALFYDCDDFLDGVSIAERLNESVASTFKTLVTVGKSKNYFVFVVPVAKELDLKKAAKAVGEKSVEMIHVNDILKVTGYIRGGCSPFGMKKQFMTVFDISAFDFDFIMFSGGRRGVQIKMNPKDIEKVIKCSFENIVH